MPGASSNTTTGKRHLAADQAQANGATKSMKRRKLGKSTSLVDEGKKNKEKKTAEGEVAPQPPKDTTATTTTTPKPEVLKDKEKDPKKKKERKEKKGKTTPPSKAAPVQPQIEDANGVDTTPQESKLAPEQHHAITEVVGGRFDDYDPAFSDDEKHLFLSAEDAVHVLSTATSSLVRILCPSPDVKVTGYVISCANREHIYIATITGNVYALDWTTGEQVSTFDASNGGGRIHGIYLSAFEAQKTDKTTRIEDIVFLLGEKTVDVSKADDESHDAANEKEGKKEFDKTRFISAHMATPAGRWKSRAIFNTHFALNPHLLRPSLDGKVIMAAAGNMLIAGSTSQISLDTLDELSFEWLEMALPLTQVTSLDVHSPIGAGERNAAPKKALKNKRIDLVVGEKRGSILIYNDILNTLIKKASQKEEEKSNEVISTRLHWHRYPVRTVRWSRDGNYLISGGAESVLVLWQLDTGRKQFLPHLVSNISTISVSPFGDAYAVKLANNSVMVLSTSELQPTANISGLQILAPAKKHHSKNSHPGLKHRVCALLHPLLPGQILVTVPSTPAPSVHSESLAPSSFSFMQTYDLRANRHVARQPLTRTHVTVLSNGPEGTPLTTPDVTHLAITPDARWLASIDSWRQYTSDSRVLNPTAEGASPAEEIFLKIWRWDGNSCQWELNTRVEKPHVISGGLKEEAGAAQVLDLVAKPGDSRNTEKEESNDDEVETATKVFVTLGTDAAVRMWSPMIRNKGSRKDDTPAVDTWQCSRSIHLEKSGSTSAHAPLRDGRICYSADGSVLGICWMSSRGKNHVHGVVHLIDAESGRICHSRSAGIFAHDAPVAVKGIGFVDKYLVVLSQGHLAVWDTVADIVRTLNQPSGTSIDGALSLCVNQTGNTFAVLFNSGLIAVYAPAAASPISTVDVTRGQQTQIVSVLADPFTGDFLVADSLARVHRLSSGDTHVHLADDALESRIEATTKAIVPKTDVRDKLQRVAEATEKNKDGTLEEPVVPGVNDGPAGVNKNVLASVFDVGPSFAMPSVQTLFDSVIRHFGAK